MSAIQEITKILFKEKQKRIVNFIKARKGNTPLIMTIRNISICDAIVSLLSLEKSMYATFGDENGNSHIMTILTGAGVCASIILIGISMIRYSNKE